MLVERLVAVGWPLGLADDVLDPVTLTQGTRGWAHAEPVMQRADGLVLPILLPACPAIWVRNPVSAFLEELRLGPPATLPQRT